MHIFVEALLSYMRRRGSAETDIPHETKMVCDSLHSSKAPKSPKKRIIRSPDPDQSSQSPSESDTAHGKYSHVNDKILPQSSSQPSLLKLPLLSREQRIGRWVIERVGIPI